jgi:hypothetical protein
MLSNCPARERCNKQWCHCTCLYQSLLGNEVRKTILQSNWGIPPPRFIYFSAKHLNICSSFLFFLQFYVNDQALNPILAGGRGN